MDVLYILGTGSLWSDWETRFSFRSLERHAKGVNRVFLVGEDPGFLSDRVKFFYFPDPTTNREYNIASKIFWACQNAGLSDRFFFINDDHILLQDVDLDTYPYYHRGDLAVLKKRPKSGRYGMSILNTVKYLQSMGKPTLHFDLHTPIVYDRRQFIALSQSWERSKRQPGANGFVVKSIYCNMTGVPVGPAIRDCKINHVKGALGVTAKVEGRHVFSFSDTAVPEGVGEYLQLRFPDMSSYEMRDRPKARSPRRA